MGNILGIVIVWFIIEMLLWYLIAQFVSGWYVFGWFILASIIGISLMKKGVGTLKPMANQAQSAMFNPAMRPDQNSIIKALAMSFAGVLFLLPGILSDIFGLIVLLPMVQNKAKNYATNYANKNPEKLMQMMSNYMGGMGGTNNPFGANNPFGGQNPFGGTNPFGGQNPFGNPTGKQGNKFGGKTIDGQAKTISAPKTANDE